MKHDLIQSKKTKYPLWLERIAVAGFITVAVQLTFIYVKFGEVWRAYEFTFWIEFTFTFFYFLALFWVYPKISGFIHSPFLKALRSLQVRIIEGVIVVLSTLVLTLTFKLLPMGLLLFFLNFLNEDVNLQFDNDAVRQSLIIHAFLGLLLYYFVERERIRKRIQAEHLRYARLQREEFKNQLENLKNQVNPHFLFNSLDTLDGLIEKDPEGAVLFVNRLSFVYRSFLDQEEELVPVSKEMELVEAYTYLLKVRFGEQIHFEIKIPGEYRALQLPPGSLQVLIENAVLSNEMSDKKPLTISVHVREDKLVMRNDLPVMGDQYEPGAGLKNIMERYRYLTDDPVEIEETKKEFVVKLPLLKLSN